MRLARRQLLLGFAQLGLAGEARAARTGLERVELDVGPDSAPVRRAVAFLPRKASGPVPCVVLLHGFAEAADVERALSAWEPGYGLLDSRARLENPPLEPGGALEADRARELSESLSQRPFRDVALVCPRTPVPYRPEPGRDLIGGYASWLLESLLPAVGKRCTLRPGAGARGLVGFSMGGRVALELLMRRPGSFGRVSLLQPELLAEQDGFFARRVAEAHGTVAPLDGSPAAARAAVLPAIQVLTAHGDPNRARSVKLAGLLRRYSFTVELQQRRGRHRAEWMQQLGTLESLWWQERALHAPPD